MKFQEINSATERCLLTGGPVSEKGWYISSDRKGQPGVALILQDEQSCGAFSSESFITVSSGSSAYISVGKDIPYRERWLVLSRRYADLVETVVFQRVETGREVRPVLTGKVARVEIIPRISYETGEGEKGMIRFTAAQTELTLPLKQWVAIGGSTVEDNEVMKALLESGKGTQDRSVAIWMMVETQ